MKINLYEPGALDELFARNRERYGDLRMMAEPDDDGDPGDDQDEDDDPDLDEDDEQDEDGKGKDVPIPDAEGWAKVQRKLQRQEDRITRLLGRKATPAKKSAAGKGKGDVDEQLRRQLNQGDDDEEQDEAAGEAARWKGIAVQNAAASQIAAAGFSGTAKQAARLARLIDTSDIEPSRDGTFDLEDEIDELKEEYPQLFSTSVGRRPAPRIRTASSGNAVPAPDPNLATSKALLKAAGYR